MSDLTKKVDLQNSVDSIAKLLIASATSYLEGNALEVSAVLQDKVISKLPAYLQVPVNLYYPAVSRLALNEIIAFSNTLTNGDAITAQNQLRAVMTTDELAQEKVALAALTAQLASDNAIAQQTGRNILKTVLTVALGLILKV